MLDLTTAEVGGCLPSSRVSPLRADEVRKERKKATKHDAAHRLASVLHVDGKDGVEAEYEKSDAFHSAWRLKSQDMLARAAFRRKKLVQRLQVQMQLRHLRGGAHARRILALVNCLACVASACSGQDTAVCFCGW